MRKTLLLTLALLAGCSASVDRSGDSPPVAADFDSLLALCSEIAGRSTNEEIAGVTWAESDFERLRRWAAERGDAALRERTGSFRDDSWQCVVRRFESQERRGEPKVAATYQDGAILTYTVDFGGRGELHPSFPYDVATALVAYREVEGEWRMTMLPVLDEPGLDVTLPVSSRAVPTPPLSVSPLLRVRSFPDGGVPDSERQNYIDMGTMIPDDGPWQDVIWKGRVLYYPGCDPLGHTDPIGPRGTPDVFARLEETITGEWMPYMSYEDDPATGRLLKSDPVTLCVERTGSVELLGQVVRMFARRKLMLRHVHLRVASTEGPGAYHIALRQPLGWVEQEASPVVAAGASESEVTAALASMLDGRAGVRATAGATVQQLVDTLDLLAAHGATDLYLAVLPEGYEAIPKD